MQVICSNVLFFGFFFFYGLVALKPVIHLLCHVMQFSRCLLFSPLGSADLTPFELNFSKLCNGENVHMDFISPQMVCMTICITFQWFDM